MKAGNNENDWLGPLPQCRVLNPFLNVNRQFSWFSSRDQIRDLVTWFTIWSNHKKREKFMEIDIWTLALTNPPRLTIIMLIPIPEYLDYLNTTAGFITRYSLLPMITWWVLVIVMWWVKTRVNFKLRPLLFIARNWKIGRSLYIGLSLIPFLTFVPILLYLNRDKK